MLTFSLAGITDANEAESIGRCLKNLYSTPAGSIPCDRNLDFPGLGWIFHSQDMEALVRPGTHGKTDKYEPG